MLRIGSDSLGSTAIQNAAPGPVVTPGSPAPISAKPAQANAYVEKKQVNEAELRAAVERVNRVAQMRNTQIQFQIDTSTKRVITKIVDPSTKEVLRQIPNEEVLRISAAIASGESNPASEIPLVRAVA
jgi:flagellar protein FlaG